MASISNVMANFRHVSLYERAVRVMRENLKLKSEVSDCGRKKCERGCGRAWQILHLAGVWNQAIGFVLVYFAVIWLELP